MKIIHAIAALALCIIAGNMSVETYSKISEKKSELIPQKMVTDVLEVVSVGKEHMDWGMYNEGLIVKDDEVLKFLSYVGNPTIKPYGTDTTPPPYVKKITFTSTGNTLYMPLLN